jgi:MinD-like ATPase involved in chromosome partitioning or flagellar assembly
VYVLTFYSFKGGVGRTFALVNVAAELARRGRRVLLVDFDLEAPGLETFDRLRPPQPHPGVVEYVKEYLTSQQSPDVRDYTYSTKTIGKKGGQLWVMPAGRRDAEYQTALASIDWKRLYRECQGYWFFEDTKKQWEEAFKPDYVLIDSRTGHTDVEGICTRQLPDAVVVLFFPNEQNLAGLRDVCRRIRSEKDSGLKKDIRLHFVMSNVPDLDDEDNVLRHRLEAFHKELEIDKLDAVIHRYESVMLFNQAVFVLDRPRSRLAREYRTLVKALIREHLAREEQIKAWILENGVLKLAIVLAEAEKDDTRTLGIKMMTGMASPLGAELFGISSEQLSRGLIRVRAWRDAIQILERAGAESLDLGRMVDLAMAYWGETGEAPEDLCRRVQANDGSEGRELETNHPDAKALVLWRLGKQAEALSVLDRATEQATKSPEPRFSYWRYREVSPDQFVQDCQQLRRMIQGEPLRPAFLGEPGAPHASTASQQP